MDGLYNLCYLDPKITIKIAKSIVHITIQRTRYIIGKKRIHFSIDLINFLSSLLSLMICSFDGIK